MLYREDLERSGKNVSTTEISFRTAVLQIYFSTMQSQTITNVQAYDFMALLSDIGGALGLLLGATLLTLLEIAEFLLIFIHGIIKIRRKFNDRGDKTSEVAPRAIQVAVANEEIDFSIS